MVAAAKTAAQPRYSHAECSTAVGSYRAHSRRALYSSTVTESGSRGGWPSTLIKSAPQLVRGGARHTHDECSVDTGTRDRGVTGSVLGDKLRESPWRLWTLASVDHIAEEHNRQYHKALEVFVRRHVTDHARLTNAPAPASCPAKLQNDCLRNALVIQAELVSLWTMHG